MLLVQDETSYSQMKKKSKTTVAAVGKHTSDIICTQNYFSVNREIH